MNTDLTQDLAQDAVLGTAIKSVPPVAVAGMTLFGVSLPDLVLIVTLIWLVVQITGYCYDRAMRYNRGKGSKKK